MGLHYEKQKTRPGATDAEWTPLMAVFLARLSRQLGFFQEREYGSGKAKIDFAWFRGTEADPVVAIEHENDPIEILESELPALLKCGAPLSILITYPYNMRPWHGRLPSRPSARELSAEGLPRIVETELRRRRFQGQFLLVIGGLSMDDPSQWWFHSWDGDRRSLVQLAPSQDSLSKGVETRE